MQRRVLLPILVTAVALAGCSSSKKNNAATSSSPAASVSASASAAPSSSAAAPSSAAASTPAPPASSAAAPSSTASGNLTVWVDAVRLPDAKAYQAAHPKVNITIVTFDGDGNGATGLQTKIQLWNKAGSGWPDVIFSEQVNDPVWMAQAPFDFAADMGSLISKDITSQWPATSLGQCTVGGKLVCLQDNLAPNVLWVNQKLMTQFGYTVPKTWQDWQALGQKVATEHPGYIIGNTGDSYGAWTYFWGNQCPLESNVSGTKVTINAADTHCTEMATLLDPLIKNGSAPPLGIFSPDFAKKYGGATDKVLLMPGPAWYAQDVFGGTLHIPAGEMTATTPLQWGTDSPITTGQIGGGPWIISKHSANTAAATDFVQWSTTVFNPDPTSKDARAGLPGYGPLQALWLAGLAKNPYFAADPTPALKAAAGLIWQGWQLVTYPDQPVWTNTVVTGLVAGKSLSSLMPAFGKALGQAAKAAGYTVATS
jgi:ABC-type glycerol-3-phosphate transport system substrate-binding protein